MSDTLVATLIAANGLSQHDLLSARTVLQRPGARILREEQFDWPYAVDLHVQGTSPAHARKALEAALHGIDIVVQRAGAARRKRLLIADMDSTMIQQECIDELADFAGLKTEIAAITARAMRGELDFEQALDERVAALKGLSAAVIDECLSERIQLTPGATTLIGTMKKLDAKTILVSGGFTAFTGPIAAKIGFDRQIANTLDIKDNQLAGTVARPIVDKERKVATLRAARAEFGLDPAATLAIGDGANDIRMIEEAGLGIAYHAKPKTAAAADAAIRYGDLRAILWAQGIPQREWAA